MRNLILLVLVCLSYVASAQELRCSVKVNSQKISGDKTVFQAMQKSLFEFINTRKWTNDKFTKDEVIECTMMFNITERVSTDQFKGTLSIQSTRPIFGTDYNSTMFNYIDKDIMFNYVQSETLEFSETAHLSNLTAIVGFYVNFILGLDYDSFAMNGGSKFFQKAKGIVNNAQTAREAGWKAFEGDRNRYWLIENHLHAQFKGLRKCYYLYHRKGFDLMNDKIDEGRAAVATALEELRNVYRQKPNSFNLQLFFNAKSDEIVKLFSKGYPDEKGRMTTLLKQIDPGNGSKYEKIQKG